MSGPMDAASREAWGSERPDWVAALAAEADATSQTRAAKRLGRSGSVVSQVLRACYAGSLQNVEELVRGRLMSEEVACPAKGVLPLHRCQDWRRKYHDFAATNAERVQMRRACHRCPIRIAKEGEA